MTMPASTPTKGTLTARPKWRTWVRPELATVGLLLLAFVAGSLLSPYFLDAGYLLDSTSLYMEIGVMAIAMTFVIIAGQIDLSVASGLVLVSVVSGLLLKAGWPVGVVVIAGLALGVLLGAFNGLLITRLGLPALTVTLGTLALYRGVAEILLGDKSAMIPAGVTGMDRLVVAGFLPIPLGIFLVLAIALGLVLHRTVFGRWMYAVGTNEAAARYAGIPVNRVKMLIFAISGFMSGLGGLMLISRLGVARHDLAVGQELDVVTAVVLGGTDINGGRGSMFGTVAALFLVGILRTGMGLADVKIEKQVTVIGALLIFSIILSKLPSRARR